MTLRGILLAAAFMASQPVEAHCYSRWHFPWPQRCQVAGHRTREMARWPQAPSRRVAHVTPTVGEQGLLPSSATCCADPDMPLPSLTSADLDGGEADEPTRTRVLLRAALEAANGH
jgi:hypothetical protein